METIFFTFRVVAPGVKGAGTQLTTQLCLLTCVSIHWPILQFPLPPHISWDAHGQCDHYCMLMCNIITSHRHWLLTSEISCLGYENLCFHMHACKPPFFDYTVECLHFEIYNFPHFRLTLALLDMHILWTLLFNSFNRQPYTRVGNNFPQHIKIKLNSGQTTLAVTLLHHHSILKLSINLINIVSWFTWAPMGKFLATAATYHFFNTTIPFLIWHCNNSCT
jgi:hypothetical protein